MWVQGARHSSRDTVKMQHLVWEVWDMAAFCICRVPHDAHLTQSGTTLLVAWLHINPPLGLGRWLERDSDPF